MPRRYQRCIASPAGDLGDQVVLVEAHRQSAAVQPPAQSRNEHALSGTGVAGDDLIVELVPVQAGRVASGDGIQRRG